MKQEIIPFLNIHGHCRDSLQGTDRRFAYKPTLGHFKLFFLQAEPKQGHSDFVIPLPKIKHKFKQLPSSLLASEKCSSANWYS
jgi:hypothetical protein